MKRLSLLIGLAAAASFCGQPLSQHDRDFAMSNLHSSAKMFLDSIGGLSKAQWNFKPAPDRWSIAECAEHIALTEDEFTGLVQKTLKQPAAPSRKPGESDEAILARMRDRSKKAKADAAGTPKNRWPSAEEVGRVFKERRGRTLDYVRTTQDPLRAHFLSSSPQSPDAYQFLLMAAGHTERHVAQIEEVKADPRFPKR